MTVNVPIPSVFLRIGVIAESRRYIEEFTPTEFAPSAHGLLLYWDPVKWLNVTGTAAPGTKDVRPLEDKPDLQDKVCRELGLLAGRRMLTPPKIPDFFDVKSTRITRVPRDSTVELDFVLRTDEPQFAKLSEAATAGPITFVVSFTLFDGTGGVVRTEHGSLAITLDGVRSLHPFDGCIALDLGNTSNAIACIPAGRATLRAIRVLDAADPDGQEKLKAEARATLSHVRIEQINSWDPKAAVAPRRFTNPEFKQDELPPAVEWVIGDLAEARTRRGVRGLVLGAKRLVAGAGWEQTQGISVRHVIHGTDPVPEDRAADTIDLVNRVPAELLACRMLQKFARAKDGAGRRAGWGWHMALTYPTTFFPREVDRLRRTVYRAWLRMQFRRQVVDAWAPPGAKDPNLDRIAAQLQQRVQARQDPGRDDDPLFRLLLDEASAAAFYFLYARVVESPGGLASFKYHFPNGLNLLLYDCGGGTTDIALVSATLDPDNEACLRIRIRGGSGVRHFGGDNITTAVARLLKAKIAVEVAKARRLSAIPPPPTPPAADATLDDRLSKARTAAVRKYLADVNEKFDGEPDPLVPTRFDPLRVDGETNDRRDNVSLVWDWAESLKRALAETPSAKLADIKVAIRPQQSKLSNALMAGLSDADRTDLGERLDKLAIHRWEVDALVGDWVARSAANCNSLIRDRLARDPLDAPLPIDAEDMVHWVAVSGNGSRYPLVTEVLRARLEVPSLARPGRFTHDPQDLKHAVAKGAVLALAVARGQGAIDVRFDTAMIECLPCEIGHKDMQANQYLVLFAHQKRFDKLGLAAVSQSALKTREGAGKLEEFSLYRRFPGDEGLSTSGNPDEDEPSLDRGWSAYLVFQFKDKIQGDLTVSYDLEKMQFKVVDSAQQEGIPREVEPEQVYRSPVQRGNL